MKFLPTLFTLTFAAAALAQEPEMPKPGPQHQKLAASAGTWDALIEMAGPDGKPSTSKGVSEMKIALGGFWLVDDFAGELMGSKFVGHGLTGYDPIKGKYVGTWVDSMSPSLMVLEGDYDQSGKVLTMTGMGIGMDGQPAKHRMVSTHKDANTTLFEMYVAGAGADQPEQKMLTITYTRRAKASDAAGTKR